MKHAYVFPGQGAQAVGMGKDLYDNVPAARELFEKANEILGFRITDIMFAGTDEELRQTRVTQPAVFLHSVIMAKALGVEPDAVAGHSLGEFSALVVAGALSFEDGLKLVSKRAMAMQAACEAQPGTMAAILGLDDKTVEEICASIDGVVVAANYNCPGQLVISGAVEAVDAACEKAKAAMPDVPVDGEFQFDAAVSPRVARTKCPDSKVAGHANTFIFPNINAGNIGYKIAQRLGGFDAYGPILLGLNAPINDLSRGCNAQEVYSMAIITAGLCED